MEAGVGNGTVIRRFGDREGLPERFSTTTGAATRRPPDTDLSAIRGAA
jgi:hypothetical protein